MLVKKILWIGIAYGALILVQLISSFLFPFLKISMATKVLTFVCLLIASGAMIPISRHFFKKEEAQMENRSLAVFHAVHKQATLLMAAGTFYLFPILSELFLDNTKIIQLTGAALLAAACVAAALRIYRASFLNGKEQTDMDATSDDISN